MQLATLPIFNYHLVLARIDIDSLACACNILLDYNLNALLQ